MDIVLSLLTRTTHWIPADKLAGYINKGYDCRAKKQAVKAA